METIIKTYIINVNDDRTYGEEYIEEIMEIMQGERWVVGWRRTVL